MQKKAPKPTWHFMIVSRRTANLRLGFIHVYIGLLVLGFISSPFIPLMLLLLMENPRVKTEYMGAAGGMFFCVAEIGGFSGPALMGILVDVTGTFMAGTIFLAVLCIGIAIMTFYIKAER